MTFDGLLKSELAKISTLNDNVYPIKVPQDVQAPYVAYCMSDGTYLKTLDGEEPWEFTYEVNILSKSYGQLKLLEKQVQNVLRGLEGKGSSDGTVKEISMEVPEQSYEEKVDLQKSVIQFTIYF